MDLSTISKTLADAAMHQEGNQNGMKISLPGVLSHAHRALIEMAQPFEDAPEHIVEQFDDRLQESQPAMRAYGLEELNRHLALLKNVFNTGDSATIRQFFDLYDFD